tara:strand:+ start:679 stop:909 length:231 start_codon:yes stop_codon:yes gene_type:complete
MKLNKIFFDGKGYLKRCLELDNHLDEELVKICSRFNFTPVDSISFKEYQHQTYCDIKIDNYFIKSVCIEHLYTQIP